MVRQLHSRPLFRPAFYLIACKQARYEVFSLCVPRCKWIDGITIASKAHKRAAFCKVQSHSCTEDVLAEGKKLALELLANVKVEYDKYKSHGPSYGCDRGPR